VSAPPVDAARQRRLRVVVPILLAGLSMLGPFSIDTPFPAFTAMGADFGASTEQMQLVVSAYLLSFGLMSPFHGPLSDALGRRRVILTGVAVYAVASIGCALSPNLPVLLGFRVLQGLSAGGGVIVSRTVIRDVFEGAQAQRLMSRVMMIFSVAPAVAPIVGGLLLQVGPWSVVFVFMAAVAVLLIALVALLLPETHPPSARLPFRLGTLVGSLARVTRAASFHRVAWAAGLSFAGQFLYIGSAPIIVVDLLGKGELDFWMLFVPMIGGIMLGSFLSGRAAGRLSPGRLVTGALVFSAAGAVVNVVLGTLPTAAQLPWAVIGPALIAVGTAAAYPTLQLILLDMFPASRGAAVSMFTFFTLVLNGITAFALSPVATRSILGLAVAALVFVLAGLGAWLLHLRSGRREPRVPMPPEGGPDSLQPGEQV
jgi:DHA1 family bicyclomycin/chloramphenicol resistance-like MFS transporter